MNNIASTKLRITMTMRDEPARWHWCGQASETTADRGAKALDSSAANPNVLQKERSTMKESTAKQKPHGGGLSASTCLNPAAGQEQVIAYVVGDLSEDERRDFVAHVKECSYCLEEVVLWRMSQVLAESTDKSLQANSAAN